MDLSWGQGQLHTDAIKDHLIPVSTKWRKEWEYAEEVDLLNAAIFGFAAKEWKKANPKRVKAGEILRDSASINELNVVSNAESKNAEMIREGLDKKARFLALQKLAEWQLKSLNEMDFMKSIKKTSEGVYLTKGNEEDKK